MANGPLFMAAVETSAARAGWAVLAAIVLVLLCALFLMTVVILALGRRRRRLAAESATAAPAPASDVDAWQEAGRRLTSLND
jgi:hypothetical protein